MNKIPFAEIEWRLSAIESERNVRIILAAESGSRAWGFPSPDSDFDVRFIYVRHLDDYMSLQPGRDTIEPAIDGLMDFSGWDLRKAINLLLKSNAVASEWLESPILYRNSPEAGHLRAFADAHISLGRLRYHYFNLGNSIWQERLAWRDQIAIKKYFYVIRPAIVLRHMRVHGKRPPMHLDRLIPEADLPPEIASEVERLVEMKLSSREMGMSDRITALDLFINDELGCAQAMLSKQPGPSVEEVDAGSVLFRQIAL